MPVTVKKARNKIIVVVEDDDAICTWLDQVLSKEGYQVFMFKHGEEALEQLKLAKLPVDLLVLDLMLPGRGGYDILTQLQSTSKKDVPVIVITARQLDTGTLDMILSENNVKDLIEKPIHIDHFRSKVRELISSN